VQAELTGAGPLEPLLRTPGITDVLVNGPDDVWIDRGSGLERVPVRFPSQGDVRRLAVRLAAAGGRRLDDAAPFVDARLPDGVRLHAVLPPVSPNGVCISLRVPRDQAFTLDELVASGSVSEAGAMWLRSLVASRVSFLVTGGTGTGKTTMLSTLLGLVDPRERLVIVEDARELAPQHPHVIQLESRPPNIEGIGAVKLRDLVRQALRMRPDRLIVGEVRGEECLDLLAALNIGHDGGCGTLHANTAADVPTRLEALAAPAGLPREALHSQVAAGLQAVVHLTRDADGRRRLHEIAVVRRCGALVTVESALGFCHDGRCHEGPAAERLAELVDRRA
jgi:pilus assembly protein CpaF